MYKKNDYLHFSNLIYKVIELETLNRGINEEKLKKGSLAKNELIKEFIATNNIEGDIVSSSLAKRFLKEQLSKSELEKRWIGIKYAHDIIWSNDFTLNIEYMHETHRALLRNVDIPGGIWKTKINQVGSLITTHPDDVPTLVNNALGTYLSSKITDLASVFNIIPFISEFLAIHPYEDGNGRMSRLIMSKELYEAGFKFVKYISVSKFLWEDQKRYIDALEKRNKAWSSKSLKPSDLIPLFEVILDSLIKAAQVAFDYQNKKTLSYNDFKKELLLILQYEQLSISQIEKKLNLKNSRSSINKWLKELIENKDINIKGNKKASIYYI